MIPFLIGCFIWCLIGAIVSGIYIRLVRYANPDVVERWVAIVFWPIDLIQIIYMLVSGTRV